MFKYLVCLATRALGVENSPVNLDVANVEEFRVLETILSTCCNVWPHVVQLSEVLGERNVALICKLCATEDDDSPLISLYVSTLHFDLG
jgi:hypothetical protein